MDVAPGQDGAGSWWNDIRREENPGELATVRSAIKPCPKCEEGTLWASFPYWYVYCDCGTTMEFDEPEDAVEAFNDGQVTDAENAP